MRNNLKTAEQRLKLASAEESLSPAHRKILCDIISAEIDGSLAGIYGDIPIQVYHHPLCTGYSSTLIKKIVESSFNKALVNKMNAKALRFGSAFHSFCNEPKLFSEEYAVSPVNDSRRKEWQDCADTGKIVLSMSDFQLIEKMSRKIFSHPEISPLFYGSEFEVTAFSQDSETGLWKKARADIKKGLSLYDLKSCEKASEIHFTSDAKKYLYRISASWYLEVFSEAGKAMFKDFWLIACEKEDPQDPAKYRVSDASIERAQAEIRRAVSIIKKVIDEGPDAWTGYELGVKEIWI